MGTLAQKLQYTVDAVDGIEVALQNKGVETNGVPLGEYAGLIDSIPSGAQVDRVGLAALGYNDSEIDAFQEISAFEPVPDWNITEPLRTDIRFLPRSVFPTSYSISASQFKLYKALLSLVIPKDVTEIGAWAFESNYALTQVLVMGDVYIQSMSFRSCLALSRFVAKGEISAIYTNAFLGCSAFQELDLTGVTVVPALSSTNAFDGVHAEFKILVPMALLPSFQYATNWSAYADRMIGV